MDKPTKLYKTKLLDFRVMVLLKLGKGVKECGSGCNSHDVFKEAKLF